MNTVRHPDLGNEKYCYCSVIGGRKFLCETCAEMLKRELHDSEVALGRIRGLVGAHDGHGYESIIEAVRDKIGQCDDNRFFINGNW